MAISFETVPSNLRTPGAFIEISNANAVRGPALKAYRALIIGQHENLGSISSNTPRQISDASQAIGFFGRGTMIERMIRAFRANNPTTDLWAIALADDAGGVRATFTITITGSPSIAGVLAFYIGGQRITVPVAAGDGQNTVATAINAALVAAASDLPVTSQAAANVVTLTARHKGEVGNSIDIRFNYYESDSLVGGTETSLWPGVNAFIAQTVTGMTNPSLAPAIAAMGDVQYDIIAHPYLDAANLALLKTELDARWGPLEMIEGHAISAMSGTFSALSSFGAGQNNPHLTVFGVKGSPTPTYERAAAHAAVQAFHGQQDPARPTQTLPLVGVLAPVVADRFTQAERNLLLFDGIATERADADGTVRIDRAITTYQTSAAGAADPSYLDVTSVLTLAYLRYSLRNRFLTRYPRHKLAQDGTRYSPGQAIVTPKTAKIELCTLFSEWEELGLVEDFEQFKRDMVVEINPSDPTRLDIRIAPNLVNGLVVIAGQIAFVL